jgi:hypothetical protein
MPAVIAAGQAAGLVLREERKESGFSLLVFGREDAGTPPTTARG